MRLFILIFLYFHYDVTAHKITKNNIYNIMCNYNMKKIRPEIVYG